MQKSILCIGELLIDFICSDISVGLYEGSTFIKKAGGAPANVGAAISKLGGKAIFAGKVGKDPFGDFLGKTLLNAGVDISLLVKDEKVNTTLAFVALQENGERDFIFNRGADELLEYQELSEEIIRKCEIMHFGSATALLGGPLKETYLQVMELANKLNVFIAFDPNFREDLWRGNEAEFIDRSKRCFRYVDFVKVSDTEMRIISGQESLQQGLMIFHGLGAKIVAVTLGAEGTLISNGQNAEMVPSIKIKPVDSTGAGDAFVGAVLYQIAKLENPQVLVDDFTKIKCITAFANKVGAIVCTKMGAISALPFLEEVNRCG